MNGWRERGVPEGGPEQRHILFLQGPASPFFLRLGQALKKRGHRVTKINFNLGDVLFWPREAKAWRGRFSRWQDHLAKRLEREGITDLVLFGDCRSYHRVAIDLARTRGIAVHVFEEGYLRPNWITLEHGGVNGFSALPNTPNQIRQGAEGLEDAQTTRRSASGLRNRVIWDVAYNLTTSAGRLVYPLYRHHRPWPVLLEYAFWLKRLALMPVEKRRSRAALRALAKSEPGFFIFPLQLDSDFQIRVHADLNSMEDALQVILRSFADHAPANDHLVVKAHPLDNGLVDRRRQCRRLARAAGIEDRVLFIEGGNLSRLIDDSKGVVTVNSTSGMVALQQKRPVAVLGRAIYHIPGLTHQGSLDSFWSDPRRPKPDLLRDFVRLLQARALIHGSFFTEEGLEAAIKGAIERIESTPPGWRPIPVGDSGRAPAPATVTPRAVAAE
ncbi:capsule biosynthesis protein [Aquibaculum arenosum]|uniref:Capsular biosynthesis protein n=1 Tax=Aquibaculum arenosum TaxID=3032591 RepID=A0ABT5YRI3_9PROT|nr:capsular biosynthesis protein [Fodinicurvata sp. CAU 1616]MDF2097428.1 capsular biosynthesis protein [Fodinicurvata sp. CAU 1616]